MMNPVTWMGLKTFFRRTSLCQVPGTQVKIREVFPPDDRSVRVETALADQSVPHVDDLLAVPDQKETGVRHHRDVRLEVPGVFNEPGLFLQPLDLIGFEPDSGAFRSGQAGNGGAEKAASTG